MKIIETIIKLIACIIVFINLAAGMLGIGHQFPIFWQCVTIVSWLLFLNTFKAAAEYRWKKINVGNKKEAEFAALKYGLGGEFFMQGFRYARNNLQKAKGQILRK